MTVDELEEYFKGAELPKGVRLRYAQTIPDVKRFLELNIPIARAYPNDPHFNSSYKNLLLLKEILGNPTTGMQLEEGVMIIGDNAAYELQTRCNVEVYKAMRNAILAKLSVVFDEITYKDADTRDGYLGVTGYKNHGRTRRACHNEFYVKDWLDYMEKEDVFNKKMEKQISWIIDVVRINEPLTLK
uniref:DUF6965 family protein n=1 Tax=Pedobacter schmidteae TaxID=2201271 RepID=UPI000EB23BB3|nr:hypothetical protein [Pedobacter schmidteae]